MIITAENNYRELDNWLADKEKVLLVCDMSIQFLDKFFEFLNKDANGGRQYVVNRTGVSINQKRMISNFEKYVSTPTDMREYILTGVRIAA